MEPFVRWAGGKTWLIPHMADLLGEVHIEHYHEPFLGGGAIFFSLDHPKKSYLSDANSQLINTYIQVRDNPDGLIEEFQKFHNTEADYYRIREEITADCTIANAARFLFLNQTSYNGLYRVNRKGRYNVPYGFRDTWDYDVQRIRDASEKLKNTRITAGDFEVNSIPSKAKRPLIAYVAKRQSRMSPLAVVLFSWKVDLGIVDSDFSTRYDVPAIDISNCIKAPDEEPVGVPIAFSIDHLLCS